MQFLFLTVVAQIATKLNMSDLISEFRTVATFLKFISMFLFAKRSHTPWFSNSLSLVITREAKYIFRATDMF
jgi:hypothetical protein